MDANGESDASTEATATPTFTGTLDTSFGTDGYSAETLSETPQGGSSYETAMDFNGNAIVALDYGEDSDIKGIHIYKFDSTGALDTTFGSNGLVQIGSDSNWTFYNIVVDSNNAIYGVADRRTGGEDKEPNIFKITSTGKCSFNLPKT
ncbi:hypothetical protein KKA47_02160 [bacterium]|nr:hypothetical protein [bacterium]